MSGHRLTEDLEIHFLEIPKFKLKSVKEMKRLEKWLAYFSNKLNERETEELAMSETAINEAIQAEHVFMQSDVERWQYEQREKAMRDYISAMSTSRREGLRQGLEEGWREGQREGRREGRREGMLEMARSLLALNVPVDVIEKSSGLTHAEIRALQSQKKDASR